MNLAAFIPLKILMAIWKVEILSSIFVNRFQSDELLPMIFDNMKLLNSVLFYIRIDLI